MAKEKTQSAPAESAITVTVKGGAESFYRAGHRWTKAPQTIPVSDLTDEQLAALRAEPLLHIAEAG